MKCDKCQKLILGECCWDCANKEIEDKYLTGGWSKHNKEQLLHKGLLDAKNGKLTHHQDFSNQNVQSTDTRQERILTLPTDSQERKGYPLFRGCLKYFPAALAGVARISNLGNQKHNPGEDLHHARAKSSDHPDCILRHLMDTQDLITAKERGSAVTDQQILDEASQLAWRALAFSQELHEKLGKAPLAPGAKTGG